MLSFSFSVLEAIVVALMVPSALGTVVPDIEKRSAKFVKLNFDVTRVEQNVTIPNVANITELASHAAVSKRGDFVPQSIENEISWYKIDTFVGSNKQKISVQIDTGSSLLWVPNKSVRCLKYPTCANLGSYDALRSSTSKDLGQTIQLKYGIGAARGELYSDSVGISDDVIVKDLTFANIDSTDQSFGILGIGLVPAGLAPNFPQLLKDQDFVNKNAYSLYLDSLEAETGTIIFGGIDKAKYQSLTTLPVASVPDRNDLGLYLNSLSHGSQTLNIGQPALLDSGTTITYFPIQQVLSLVRQYNWVRYTNGNIFGSCTGDDLVFNFGNTRITVPYSSLTRPAQYNDGTVARDICLILISDEDFPILGDNFLRSAYVVYDLDEKRISIGQAKYTTDSNIVAIV